jgi:putative tricarboxylic transport membrane protein
MEIAAQVFSAMIQPLGIIFVLLGSLFGIVLGAIPGLSGTLGIILLLPLTFGMPSEMGIILLCSIWVGGVSGGFISATLIGIPGATGSIATCFDAYPMSLKGETVKAFGISIVASFIGTFLSVIIALFASRYIAILAIKMGPWEFFSLCFCAIILVVSLSKGNIAKGLASACLGMLIASTGFAPIDGTRRFTFGINNIAGGVDLVALMMGLFAIRQIVVDFAKDKLTLPPVVTGRIRGLGITFQEIKNNIQCIVRSFLIGLGIGFLPGMGGAIANMVAYAKAKDAHPHPEEFGKGCSTGVWATETSNNAAIGGAIIPMVALGIPGDSATAILLGALTIHGIEPGPLLFQNHPVFVYVLFVTVLVAALAVLVMQLFGMRLFPYLLRIPPHWMYPTLLVFCFIGAYSSSNNLFTCGLLLFIGALGILMIIVDLPATPLLLTYILSKMLETHLRRGFNFSKTGGLEFLTRPFSVFFLLFALFSLFMPVIRDHYSKKKKAGVSEFAGGNTDE